MSERPFQAIVARALALAAACVLPLAAAAADPLGFYLGAGVGEARVRADEAAFGSPLDFVEHHNAWKAIAGIRPLSVVGAELEYIDFGHPRTSTATARSLLEVDAHPRAAAAFGLVYAPLPLPFLDVYAKAGVARLKTSVNASLDACPPLSVSCCEVIVICRPPPLGRYRFDRSDQRFAYGAGAQVKVAGLAVRVEYERISAVGGDPDLYSVALTWHF